MSIDPANVGTKISDFRNKVNNVEFQTMEVSFFTMYPFLLWQNKIRLIHEDVFSHTINYFIYDFLKSKDQNFTTDFGIRIEKYVEEALKELRSNYSTELELKKILIPKSKLVDFHLKDENIFIECKATEMQPMPSVIPTNEYIYNSLKDSLLKAYFEQMLEVSKQINPNSENWGIILTYKEFFWSHYPNLYNIGKDNYPNIGDNVHLPPENVFTIDLYTWDKLIQIVKNGQVTILDILKKAKQNNSQKETAKQLFGMHLDEYELSDMKLSYLNFEIEQMKIENKKLLVDQK